jgi:hypothetical protein
MKKKIILIGDSIRMGYCKYVKDALEDVADVYYPNENCKFAQNVLRFIHEWKQNGNFPTDADVVHWNAGLWDVVELFGDEPISTEEYYANVIPRVHKRIRELFPTAKIIFATSTPVNEKRYEGCTFCRHNSIIERYNEIAVKALANTDSKIHDLYTFMLTADDDCHSDAVHFNNEKGTAYIGGKVVTFLSSELGISADKIRIADYNPERYSDKEIGY